jgi:hypothetical protein
MPAEGGRSGRARKRRGARVTASHAYQVGAVVCVHARDMKEPWCLAASDAETPAGTLIKQYARRWTIEPIHTSKTRTHSLFRQGCMLYELIPNMPEHRLLPLMQRFAEMLFSSGLFGGFLSAAK